MKQQNLFFKIYYFVALVIVFINSIFFVKSNLFFDMEDLPKGNFSYSTNSIDDSIKLDVYKVDNSIGQAIRIQATMLNEKNAKPRNIYWQTHTSDAIISWEGNSVVIINDTTINIPQGGYYDSRRGLSIIMEGSLEPGDIQ